MTEINFDKTLDNIVAKNKSIGNRKQALQAVVYTAFRLIRQTSVRQLARPNEYFYASRFDFYDIDPSKLTALNGVAQAAAELINLYCERGPFSDVLYYIYAPMLGFESGQHLTPPDISDFMFAITQETTFDGMIEKPNPVSIGDITGCGIGSLLLSQLRGVYEKYGKDGVACLDLTGVDIDGHMCLATAFQIEASSILFNIPYNQLSIYNANAITEYNHVDKCIFQCLPDFLRHKKYIPEREIA